MEQQATAREMVHATLLGEAFDNLPVAIFGKAEDGRTTAVNAAAAALTGYEREELLGLRAEELSGRDAADLDERLRDFYERERLPGRGPLRRKDGTVVEVDYRWRATSVGGLPFYVFLVTPAGTEPFAGGSGAVA